MRANNVVSVQGQQRQFANANYREHPCTRTGSMRGQCQWITTNLVGDHTVVSHRLESETPRVEVAVEAAGPVRTLSPLPTQRRTGQGRQSNAPTSPTNTTSWRESQQSTRRLAGRIATQRTRQWRSTFAHIIGSDTVSAAGEILTPLGRRIDRETRAVTTTATAPSPRFVRGCTRVPSGHPHRFVPKRTPPIGHEGAPLDFHV
jgi:hypothetical protein